MKRKLLASLIAVFVSHFAYAEGDARGAYLGGTFGKATLEVEDVFEESDTSLGVIGGYQFSEWFALEGHLYVAELGNSDVDIYASSLEVTPKFIFQINDVLRFYLKTGLASIAVNVDGDSSDDVNSGLGLSYGIGAIIAPVDHLHIQLGYSKTRGELESEDSDIPDFDANISQLGLGVYYHF